MKKFLLTTFFCVSLLLIHSQDENSIDSLLKEGVTLHDNGEYEAAILKYEEVLALYPGNLTALAEKAFSLLSLKEYSKAIKTCEHAIKVNPDSDALKFIFTTYGNALDEFEKPNEAIKIYDRGIKKYPDYYYLYFNKGITLSKLEKFDEALLSFEKSVYLNPYHASSHNAIARIASFNEATIPSLLAFVRFLILEPQGGRAEQNFPFVKDIMSANVEKTGKNNITINVDQSLLDKVNSKGKKENDFSTTEFILSMTAALDYDKKNKKKSQVELFMDKFETICSSFDELQSENSGFYWDYYVPYFIELKEKDFIETFSYIVYASSNEKDIMKWIDSNEDKLKDFYTWSSTYNWE